MVDQVSKISPFEPQEIEEEKPRKKIENRYSLNIADDKEYMKEYKHQYYLDNIEIYKERNKVLNKKWTEIRKINRKVS